MEVNSTNNLHKTATALGVTAAVLSGVALTVVLIAATVFIPAVAAVVGSTLAGYAIYVIASGSAVALFFGSISLASLLYAKFAKSNQKNDLRAEPGIPPLLQTPAPTSIHKVSKPVPKDLPDVRLTKIAPKIDEPLSVQEDDKVECEKILRLIEARTKPLTRDERKTITTQFDRHLQRLVRQNDKYPTPEKAAIICGFANRMLAFTSSTSLPSASLAVPTPKTAVEVDNEISILELLKQNYEVLRTASPPLGDLWSINVEQSSDQAKKAPEVNFSEKMFEDDLMTYPETMGLFNIWEDVTTYVSSLWNKTVHDEEALKIKAMKYEALLDTINKSCSDNGITLCCDYKSENDTYDINYLNKVRDVFESQALTLIRSHVKDAKNNPQNEEAQKFYRVCFDLYTQNSLSEANAQLLNLFDVAKPKEGDLLHKIELANSAVSKVDASKTTLPPNRWAKSAIDDFGMFFNPIGKGNPPQNMFNLNMGENNVSILGFGSPTIQGRNPKIAEIDPLFIGYMEYLKSTGQKHLYVSNQNGLDKEKYRNQPIMKLQELYPDNFIAITQTKNSRFYKGFEKYDANKFKDALHANFFQDTCEISGCHLPQRFKDDPEFAEWSRGTIESIHQLYFGGTNTLSKKQQKLFIETYYSLLTMRIAEKEKISYMNFTCKDGIDRGMGSLGWFSMMVHHANGSLDTADTESMFLTIFFTRAYWTRKRNIILERLERVLDDTKLMREVDPDGSLTRRLIEMSAGSRLVITVPLEPVSAAAAAAAAPV